MVSTRIKISKKQEQKTGWPKKTTQEMDNFVVDSVEGNRKLLLKQVQKLVVVSMGKAQLITDSIETACCWIEWCCVCSETFVILGKQAEEVTLGFLM